jgi:hypothetical protein
VTSSAVLTAAGGVAFGCAVLSRFAPAGEESVTARDGVLFAESSGRAVDADVGADVGADEEALGSGSGATGTSIPPLSANAVGPCASGGGSARPRMSRALAPIAAITRATTTTTEASERRRRWGGALRRSATVALAFCAAEPTLAAGRAPETDVSSGLGSD